MTSRADLQAFINTRRHAVIATNSASGAPESAIVGVAATMALELVFDTTDATRKIANLRRDMDNLWDNFFIETCADWAIPYIGDLIGYQAVAGINATIDDPRSEVANTIAFRRRKGTLLVMEELARDATGWGAHAVEFFRFLGDAQNMNHVRPRSHYAPNLRSWKPNIFMDTGFDRTAHKRSEEHTSNSSHSRRSRMPSSA